MELIIILLVIIVGILLLFLVGWLLAPLGEAGKGLFQIGAWAVKKSMENREGPAPRPQHPGERSIGEVDLRLRRADRPPGRRRMVVRGARRMA